MIEGIIRQLEQDLDLNEAEESEIRRMCELLDVTEKLQDSVVKEILQKRSW